MFTKSDVHLGNTIIYDWMEEKARGEWNYNKTFPSFLLMRSCTGSLKFEKSGIYGKISNGVSPKGPTELERRKYSANVDFSP